MRRSINHRIGPTAVVGVAMLALSLLLLPIPAMSTDGKSATSSGSVDSWFRTKPLTTSSQSWVSVDFRRNRSQVDPPTGAAGEVLVGARGRLTITFSADIKGPLEIRALRNGKVAKPGVVRFDPPLTDRSRSYTFVSPAKGKRARCNAIVIQVRSASGTGVSVVKGTLAVAYRTPARQVACA